MDSLFSGKLQTWTLIAHGITANPNDDSTTETGNSKVDSGLVNSQDGGMEFDGSENKIVLEPSQVHRNSPIAVPRTPELSNADLSLPPVSSSPGCIKMSMSSPSKCLGWCLIFL